MWAKSSEEVGDGLVEPMQGVSQAEHPPSSRHLGSCLLPLPTGGCFHASLTMFNFLSLRMLALRWLQHKWKLWRLEKLSLKLLPAFDQKGWDDDGISNIGLKSKQKSYRKLPWYLGICPLRLRCILVCGGHLPSENSIVLDFSIPRLPAISVPFSWGTDQKGTEGVLPYITQCQDIPRRLCCCKNKENATRRSSSKEM